VGTQAAKQPEQVAELLGAHAQAVGLHRAGYLAGGAAGGELPHGRLVGVAALEGSYAALWLN
jgi:hypothetical protein